MIFSSSDPLHRVIVLKEGTWRSKILDKHPEVEEYLDVYKSLIANPYYIVRDLVESEPGKRVPHTTREEYVDFIPSKTDSKIILVKTVVDHVSNPGEVVTAFISSKLCITTEGGIIYVRS